MEKEKELILSSLVLLARMLDAEHEVTGDMQYFLKKYRNEINTHFTKEEIAEIFWNEESLIKDIMKILHTGKGKVHWEIEEEDITEDDYDYISSWINGECE